MNKKAFINLNAKMLWEKYDDVEKLCDEGYDLYADGKTALFFNKNMIPTNVLFDQNMEFDCVVC